MPASARDSRGASTPGGRNSGSMMTDMNRIATSGRPRQNSIKPAATSRRAGRPEVRASASRIARGNASPKDRKSDGWGKDVAGVVGLGGTRSMKKKKKLYEKKL